MNRQLNYQIINFTLTFNINNGNIHVKFRNKGKEHLMFELCKILTYSVKRVGLQIFIYDVFSHIGTRPYFF